MLKLRLDGLRLRWNADAEHERDPVLKLWLSRDVSDTVHTIVLPEAIRTSSHPLDLPVLDFAPAEVSTSRVPLLERAKHCDINFAIFVPMRNKNQETCLNQSGDARVPLHTVLGDRKLVPRWKLSIASWGDPNNHLENNDPTIVNDKGTISFEAADVSLTLPDGVTIVPRLTDSEAATHDRVQRFKDKLLYNYMLSTVRFFGERDYSQENIRDINAFVFAGHCGLLPACAYLGTRPTGAEVGYFEHCARVVFARHKLDPASFEWKTDSRAASLLSRVLTLPANLLVYVPDLVFFRSTKNPSVFVHKTLESFDSAFARGGGDCEDLALAVILCGLQLLAAQAIERDNPVVQGLAWVRQQYVQGMVLGGVTSAEINGDYGHQEMGAHMWTVMIKKSKFVRLWRNGNLMTPEEGASAGMRPEDFVSTEFARASGLPDYDAADPVPHLPDVLVGEGTGFLVPEGTDAKHNEQRKQESLWYRVFNESARYSFRGMRQWFSYDKDPRSKNKFYETATLFETADLLQVKDPHERRVIEFSFHNRTDGTTGIRFSDLVTLDESKVAIWNVPPLNKVEAACVRDSLKNLIPLPTLSLPRSDEALPDSVSPSQHELVRTKGIAQPHHKLDQLEQQRLVARLVTEVGDGDRFPVSPATRFQMGGGGPNEPERIPAVMPVEMFLKGKLDAQRVQNLVEDCNLVGVKRVECVVENVSAGLSAYRLVFHCPCKTVSEFKELASSVGRGRRPLTKEQEFNDYGE